MIRMHGIFSGFRGLTLLFGLMLAACIPTRKEEDRAGSATELGNVVGSIYTVDNRPAAGITVTLYPDSRDSASIKTAVTDAEGEYAFKDVIGDYSLFALDGSGNGLKMDSIHATLADSIDLERLNLSPLASISGYVQVMGVRPVDPEITLEPQVEMSLSRSPFFNRVDPNSAFLWSDLPAGRYWLTLGYSYAKVFTIPVSLVPGQTLDLDTIILVNEYSSGLGVDTLKVSTSQLPFQLDFKLAYNIGSVDSVIWVLNEQEKTLYQSNSTISFDLEAGMLHDTGYTVVEMRLYLEDTTIFRKWYIDLDDSPVIPWARHYVKGIFMESEANPRANEDMQIGTFKILQRRLLSGVEMAFWNWPAVPGGDTALPDSIRIPMYRYQFGNECGEMTYGNEPELFPGDTVTFLTMPNEFWGGTTFRIRKDEDFSDFGNLAWFDTASWPLAGYYESRFGTRDVSIGAGALNVRLNLGVDGQTSSGYSTCTILSRSFTLGADGIPKENVAVPDGMTSGNLMLHFRIASPDSLFSEALAASGDYIFLDSAGRGVAGSGTDRREVQLSASEVAELKVLLAPLPAVIPIDWNTDYYGEFTTEKENPRVPPNTKYLLTGGRGCLLAVEPRSRPVPEGKLNIFHSVETWLRGHGLL